MSNEVVHEMSWTEVAPLLARWQMALVPRHDLSWDVLSGYALSIPDPRMPQRDVHGVPFAQLPQAIAALAAQCAAAAGEGEAC